MVFPFSFCSFFSLHMTLTDLSAPKLLWPPADKVLYYFAKSSNEIFGLLAYPVF